MIHRVNKTIESNKKYNSQFNFSHIKDSYFREKLQKGFIKFDPSEWSVLSDSDELALK